MLFNSVNKTSKKTVIFGILTVFFIFADRFLKILCLKGAFDLPVKVLGDFFSLHYVKNYYIAFSLPFSGPILTTLIGIIILILLVYWIKLFKQSKGQEICNTDLAPLTILITGAILNFTDRVKYGFVIDYFDLKYFTVFNLADTLICLSVLVLLVKTIKNKR